MVLDFSGAIANDSKTSAKEKEACLGFCDAESKLDKEDVDGCLAISKEVVQKFEAIKHPTGVADTLRMMVLAYRIQADVLRSAEEDKSKDIKAALSTAESLAREQAAKFGAQSDKRGEAVLLLAAGEINYNKRGGKKRVEAFEDLKKAKNLASEAGDKKVEATAVFVQANAAIKLRANDDAYRFAQESYKLYEEADDKKGMGKALHIMALAQVLAEDFEDGIKTAEQALAIFKELALRKLEAFEPWELFIIAHYYLTRKMGREAIPFAEDALELFKEVDFDGSGWTSNAFDCLTQAFICKAGALGYEGDAKKAMIISEEAVEYFERKKDKRGQVMALSTLANSYCAKGDYEQAVPLIEETREIIKSLDDARWEASILHQLASVHMLRESYAEAAFAAEEAMSIYQDLKDRHSEALAMNYITQVAIAKNDYEKAIQTAQEQAAIFNETGDKSKEASCLLTVATVHGTEGRLDDALRVAKEAQELFQEKKDRSGEARALNVLADIYCDLREVEQAVNLAKEMRAKLQVYVSMTSASMASVHLEALNGGRRCGPKYLGRRCGAAMLRRFGKGQVEKGSSSYCTAVEQTADCLCVFDIDRTLTARQNASTSCPGTRELDIWDYSYGGGKVLLSALSVAGINSTFCDNCYLGICSAGNGSGVTSAWNQFLLEQVMRSKAQDALSEQFAFVKQWTLGSRVNSPYVLMQPEGTKHRAAEKIRRWYEDQFGFQLERSKVYTFDDKVENIQSFAYSGLSSKQVSCASRHEEFVQDLGLCGARPEEILPQAGDVILRAGSRKSYLGGEGDMKAEVGAIRTLSNIYLASDMPGESVRAANEAVQLSKRVHDRRQLAENLILSSEANIALAMQDNPKGLAKGSERSLKPAREAFKVAKSIGAGKLMGMAMHQTAYVLLVTVKPDDALKSAREAVDIFRQVDERAREAGSVILIAEIYHSKSEDEKALDAANEGLMLAKACGDPKKERDANKLIEQIAGKRFAYYQPYPGEGGEMPMPAQERRQIRRFKSRSSLPHVLRVLSEGARTHQFSALF
ncbi:unnamed protein product [Effrenium voratum]|uniref:Uncharacterized protein n=1 Tax=Effrenium voratum TaxID=2562239 RepID=A0AA36N4E9_9DINO|nr:unnamed protein product [Effrenium voratum]